MDAPSTHESRDRRRVLALFLVLLVLGIGVRLGAAWYSKGIHHPDEHQQYLEQAFRRVHGYGMTFWEQDEGLRHPLYHVTLSQVLAGLEALGIDDPFTLAAMIRGLQALLVFACMVAFAWSLLLSPLLHPEGNGTRVKEILDNTPAALFLMFLLAVGAEFIYIHVRTLSENAMTVPLIVALLIWRKHPVAAGIALGLMVALRLQSLVLVFGFWTMSLVLDWRAWRLNCLPSPLWGEGSGVRGGSEASLSWNNALAPTFYLSLGLLAGLLLIGGMDYLAYGRWFHSTIANIQANILEGKAATFGTLPAYYYLVRGSFALTMTSVLAVPLLLVGMWVRPALAWLVVLFVASHSLIGHKEYRFLWGILPLVCILMAFGFQTLYERWPRRRTAFVAIVTASFMLTGAARMFFVPWRENPFFATALALGEVGKSNDVTGVAVTGTISSGCANYFYLRKNVEIVFPAPEEVAKLFAGPDFDHPRFNYLIASPQRTHLVVGLPLRPVTTCNGWTVYRVDPALTGAASRLARNKEPS